MTRDEIRVLLDREFRRMFYDKTIDGFKVDDHWYIDFDRRDTIKGSYVYLIKDRRFFTSIRLGRFNTFRGFLEVVVLFIDRY